MSADLSAEANVSAVELLRASAEVASSALSRGNQELGGWELHCHPDLRDRMNEAAATLPASADYVYGLPVLAHPNGVIFAVARGTSLILLRLPPEDRVDVQRSQWGVEPFDEQAWIDVEPWLDLPEPQPREQLGTWLARAFEYAGRVTAD